MARCKRGLNKIGKEKFGFDYKSELDIYKYLSCYKMSKKAKKALSSDMKFDSCKKWKEYIERTYSEFSYDDLAELSRYLNQRKRNTNTDYSYWGLVVPILLTLLLDSVFNMIIEFKFEEVLANNLWVAIGILVVELIVVTLFILFLIFLIYKIVKPIFDAEIEKNFWRDYKEIVDDMVKKKVINFIKIIIVKYYGDYLRWKYLSEVGCHGKKLLFGKSVGKSRVVGV